MKRTSHRGKARHDVHVAVNRIISKAMKKVLQKVLAL